MGSCIFSIYRVLLLRKHGVFFVKIEDIENSNDAKEYKKHLKNEELRHSLKALRECLGLSQNKMAEKLKPDESNFRPNYVNMENGVIPVSKPLIKRIVHVFGDCSLWWQYIAPDLQENVRYLLDEDDREILQDLITMSQKHFYDENKNISPFLNENLQRYIESRDYSFQLYESRMAIRITREDKYIDLDADGQLSLTTAVRDAIDSFFDRELAKAEANDEDE